MMTQEEFLQAIEAFLERTGLTPSRFGTQAVKDPNFVFDLRAGRMPRLDMAQRVLAFMQEYPSKRRRRAATASKVSP